MKAPLKNRIPFLNGNTILVLFFASVLVFFSVTYGHASSSLARIRSAMGDIATLEIAYDMILSDAGCNSLN